jgi:hypothetical protein
MEHTDSSVEQESWSLRRALHIPAVSHLLLIICIVALFNVYYSYNRHLAEGRALDWGKSLVPMKVQLDTKDLKTFKVGSTEEQERLRQQFAAIDNYLQWHLVITEQYFAFAYAATAGASTAAALAALALFWIAKNGMASANPYLVTTFAVCSALAISYQAFSIAGKHQQNIDANVAAYLQYTNLGNEIVSYAATGQDQSGRVLAASEFIHHVDVQMTKLNTVAIGYDASEVPKYTIGIDAK